MASDHDTACTCDRCRMMVMPTTRTVSEKVLHRVAETDVLRGWSVKQDRDDGPLYARYDDINYAVDRYELVKELARLAAENAKLRKCVEAADAYVEAVVRIENSPGMQSVYTVASAHGCPYIGGNWSGELAQYRAARAEVDNG